MRTECRILRATPCEIEKRCKKRAARAEVEAKGVRLKCSEFMEYTLFAFFFFLSAESKLNKIQWRRWRRPMQSWPPQPEAQGNGRGVKFFSSTLCLPRSLAHSLQVTMGVAGRRERRERGMFSECHGISLLNRQMLLQVDRNQVDK